MLKRERNKRLRSQGNWKVLVSDWIKKDLTSKSKLIRQVESCLMLILSLRKSMKKWSKILCRSTRYITLMWTSEATMMLTSLLMLLKVIGSMLSVSMSTIKSIQYQLKMWMHSVRMNITVLWVFTCNLGLIFCWKKFGSSLAW